MVLVKNLPTTTINNLSNSKGEIIFDSTLNIPIVNLGSGFSRLIYSDQTGSVTGLSSISATNITGTLQTASQPNITSIGTLTSLTSNGNVNIASHDGLTTGLELNGVLVTANASQLNYINVDPGIATPNKALVLDSNGNISGINDLETNNLTVNGTLVTASALELNYTDVTTIGIAQASKAVILDANKNITGINDLETNNLTVNGTLVTASALELNYTDVASIGTAQASKALVLDSNKNIVGINNLEATTLGGTLTTAAQPNITSTGTLTSLNVSGSASFNSLSVDGVSLIPYGNGGLFLRAYSTDDFSGQTIHTEILENINLSNFAPAGQTNNYSLEIIGYIQANHSEDFTFSITSDTPFRLWINNMLVLSGWNISSNTTLSTNPISMIQNKWYPIYIQHKQDLSNEILKLGWSSASQIFEIIPSSQFSYDNRMPDVKIRSTYFQDNLNIYDSTNSYLSSISVNNIGDLSLSSYTNNVNIVGHNGSSVGLELDGVLVTSSALQLNYNNVTTGLASASKALVLDSNKNISGIHSLTADYLYASNLTLSSLASFNTTGNVGINTDALDYGLEVNHSSGNVLRLTYNDSNGGPAINRTDFQITSAGTLNITPYGSSPNVNITNHDGLIQGLELAGTLVTSSAVQLNYNNVIPGNANALKTLVLDSSSDIGGINSLSASSLTGTLLTSDQPNINSVNILNIINHDGSSMGLELGGVLITSTATQLNYVNIIPGSAVPSKALVLDSSSDIYGINSLSASSLTGTLQTAAQPNINSVNVLNIINHDQSTNGLELAGVLVTSNATQLNYNNVVPGLASASKTLVLDSSSDIYGINSLSANNLTGTLQTSYQPNLTSINVLNISNHDNSSQGLELAGILVIASATQLNYNNVTPGSASANHTLVLDVDSTISGINSLSTTTLVATNINGTLQTSFQPNITSVDTLNIVNHNDSTIGLQLAGVLVTSSALQLNYNNVLPGSATASKTLVLDSNSNISGINNLYASNLTGTLLTSSQPNINSVNTLNIINHDGSTQGLELAGTLVTSTADQLNYVNTTPGSASAYKALILDSNSNINGINNLSASSLTGTIQTASQPNISSVNILNIINHNGSTMGLELDGTLVTSSAVQLNYVNVIPGLASNSKALILDSSSNIAGINSLSASSLTGILQTAAQPNINSVNTLDIINHDGSTQGLELAGTLVTSTATQLNYTNVIPGIASNNKAIVLDSNTSISGINILDLNILNANYNSSSGNDIVYPITITGNTTNNPYNGLGVGIEFLLENSQNNDILFASMETSAVNINSGNETGQITMNLMNNGTYSNVFTLTYSELAVQSVAETSDRRVKKDLVRSDLEDSYNKIMKLKLTDYTFIKDKEGRRHRGLIAQELKEVIPDAVHIIDKDGYDDFHTVSGKELLGYLIGTVQHMNNKYNDLENKYNDLLHILQKNNLY